ncbi:DUF2971 domain-containing protein [Vibrio furnissii]|uniref:DUF2971 domain-containing protein n=1 Tax=Vibrio furnissii TaxID=29494 RepID=UPI0037510253
MKVFHYMSAKYALEALQYGRLKVSRYEDFNDPFELLSMSLEDQFTRNVVKAMKRELNDKIRVLCCSRIKSNPLMWGHYADKHKGIVLELEVPKNKVTTIEYKHERPVVDIHQLVNDIKMNPNSLELNKILNIKYADWHYEEEVRLEFGSDQVLTVGAHDFVEIGRDVKIVGLHLGPLNQTKIAEIEDAIPSDKSVMVTKLRMAFKTFKVVNDQRREPVLISGSKL